MATDIEKINGPDFVTVLCECQSEGCKLKFLLTYNGNKKIPRRPDNSDFENSINYECPRCNWTQISLLKDGIDKVGQINVYMAK